jgi:hypothetical protein
MALLPGVIEAAGNRGVVQMTRSACAPIGGLATHTLYLNRVWGQNCIAFNRSVVEAIKANPSIRTVIIASAWVPLKNTGDELTIGDKITPWSAEVGLAALRATIAELRRAGKRVVLIGSTPAFGADPVQCQQRRSAGLIVFRECDSRPVGSQADQQLSRLSQDVPVLLPRAALCSAHACDLRGMRDAGHLNDTGAIVVARRLKLAAAIR